MPCQRKMRVFYSRLQLLNGFFKIVLCVCALGSMIAFDIIEEHVAELQQTLRH
jgi:hypothetical protein